MAAGARLLEQCDSYLKYLVLELLHFVLPIVISFMFITCLGTGLFNPEIEWWIARAARISQRKSMAMNASPKQFVESTHVMSWRNWQRMIE